MNRKERCHRCLTEGLMERDRVLEKDLWSHGGTPATSNLVCTADARWIEKERCPRCLTEGLMERDKVLEKDLWSHGGTPATSNLGCTVGQRPQQFGYPLVSPFPPGPLTWRIAHKKLTPIKGREFALQSIL